MFVMMQQKKSTDRVSAFMSRTSRWVQKLLFVACRCLLGAFFRILLSGTSQLPFNL
jgi:hypothetical protein